MCSPMGEQLHHDVRNHRIGDCDLIMLWCANGRAGNFIGTLVYIWTDIGEDFVDVGVQCFIVSPFIDRDVSGGLLIAAIDNQDVFEPFGLA